jgi:hypothetical protein
MKGLAVAALGVLAVVSVLWTIILVIVTSELRRASRRLQTFIRSLELELHPTIQQARGAIRTLNRSVQGAADGMEWARGTLATLDKVGETIRAATRVVRSGSGALLIPAAGLLAGVRVGANVLWKLNTQRRRRHA